MVEKTLSVKVFHYPEERPVIPDGRGGVSIYMLLDSCSKKIRCFDDLRWCLYQFEIDTMDNLKPFSWVYEADLFDAFRGLR